MTDPKLPVYDARLENLDASPVNPQRIGRFVKVVRVPRPRMNAGTWWQLTDGRGSFWQVRPDRLRLVPDTGHPDARLVTEDLNTLRTFLICQCHGDPECAVHGALARLAEVALAAASPSGGAVQAPGVGALLARCDAEDWSAGEFGWIQTTEIRALLGTDTTTGGAA